MGKRRRITKKQLKHDKLVETAAKGTKLFEQHANTILIGVAVALVAVILTVMIIRGQRSTNAAANAALAVASQSLNSGQYPRAQEQLQAIIREYPGTRSAGAAICYLGSIAYYNGDYDTALSQFETYLTQYRGSGLIERLALEGKASVQEQRSQFADASQIYEELARKTEEHGYTSARYLSGAARCHRAQEDWASLERVAGEILDRYPDTPYASRARIDLAEAQARLATANTLG